MKRNFFILFIMMLFLFGCHGTESSGRVLFPVQTGMSDGTSREYESLELVYDILPLKAPAHTPPMTFDTFPSYTGMSDPRTWAQVHGGSMIFCMDMGDERAAAVYDLSGEYQSAVRYRSPIHGNAMFTYLDSSSCYLTAEINTSPDNTGYRLIKTDAGGTVLAESAWLHRPDSFTSSVGEVYSIDGTWALTRFWMEPEVFWMVDKDLSLIGPFTTESPIAGGFSSTDGTLLLVCENNACYRFSPDDKTVMPLPLHRDTEAWRRAETVLYASDTDDNVNVYLIDRTGITHQRGNEEILLCDFARSYFDVSQFSFVSPLPDDRFLVWYTEPLTGETTPAILAPTAEEQRPVRKTVRLATVGLGSDRQNIVTAAVTHFNRTDRSFVIEHTDYDSAGGTVDQREAHLTDDLLRDERYDIFLFGSAVKLTDSLSEKGIFEDMSRIANNTDFISCVRDAYGKDSAVYTLPFTVNIRTLVTTTDILPKDTPFTWDVLYDMAEMLAGGDALFNTYLPGRLREIAIYDFVDFAGKNCSFDSPAFEKLLSFLASYEAARDPVTGGAAENPYYNPTLGYFQNFLSGNGGEMRGDCLTPLLEGKLKFLEFTFRTPYDADFLYALFDRIGAEYNLCGFPSSNGGSMHVTSDMLIALGANGSCPAGGAEFAELLLSEKIQSADDVLIGFPVVKSAVDAALDWGMMYYQTDTETHTDRSLSSDSSLWISIGPWSKTPLSAMEVYNYPEVCNVLKSQRDEMLDYLCNSTMRGAGDTMIRSIIEEELSYVSQGVRTAEEAGKIIQSRVFIYINE